MKLGSIQYLRALAATMVVVFHASKSLLKEQDPLIHFGIGAYGVDIFFVISGFIMSYTTAINPLSPGQFLLRRFIRIVPLYLLLTSIAHLLAAKAPGSFQTIPPDLPSYLWSILFIPHFNSYYHDIEPILNQGWTLNYEMFFYFVFACGLCLRVHMRAYAIPVFLLLLSAAGTAYDGRNPIILTYTNTLLIEFCFGMWIANLFFRFHAQFIKFTPAAVFLMMLIWSVTFGYLLLQEGGAVSATLRFAFAGIPSACLVALFLWFEDRGWLGISKPTLLVGEASYSLYLIHTFVLAGMRRAWQPHFDVHAVSSHLWFILISTTISVIVGIGLYLGLERNLTRSLTGLLVRTHAGRPVKATGSGA
jgi:exopolysaccharide production protein ExoZ